MASVPLSIRQQVITGANQCCEYCQTQQRLIGMPLVIDHIIPRAMGGSSDLTNLAASCYRCNEFKGARMDAVDPLTKEQVSLFHPRQQVWAENFVWVDEGIQIAGLTAIGRATVNTLKLNSTSLNLVEFGFPKTGILLIFDIAIADCVSWVVK